MIKSEVYFDENGRNTGCMITYSDKGVYITGGNPVGIYDTALDPIGNVPEYIETEKKIENWTNPFPEKDSIEAQNLAEAKQNKINESNVLLEKFLLEHPYEYNGKTYSCTMEKQTQMALQYMTYQMQKSAGQDAVLTWNETGKTCEPISEEDFVALTLGIKAYVYPIVEQQRVIEQKIDNCTTMGEVDNVEINYEVVSID